MLAGRLGKCSPGCSGRGGVLTGLLTEVLGGCSGDVPRDAARDVRGCSGVAHRFLTETLGGCSRDAQVTLLGMVGNAARVARGVLGATHRLAPGGVSRMPGGAGGPARCCPSGCAPRAPLRAPRRGWRSGGAGGRQRGGEGVASPARLSRRPGSINEIIMQIEQPCATRQPYLIPAGGEAGRAGGSPGPSPRGAGTGLAMPLRLASPVWGPCCHPPAARHPEGARPSTAGGLCQEHPGGSAPPAVPGYPGGPRPLLPGWVQGGRAVGGQETEPGRLWVRGVAWGWHGGGMGRGPCTHTHTHAHMRRSGNIKLHCR